MRHKLNEIWRCGKCGEAVQGSLHECATPNYTVRQLPSGRTDPIPGNVEMWESIRAYGFYPIRKAEIMRRMRDEYGTPDAD